MSVKNQIVTTRSPLLIVSKLIYLCDRNEPSIPQNYFHINAY